MPLPPSFVVNYIFVLATNDKQRIYIRVCVFQLPITQCILGTLICVVLERIPLMRDFITRRSVYAVVQAIMMSIYINIKQLLAVIFYKLYMLLTIANYFILINYPGP